MPRLVLILSVVVVCGERYDRVLISCDFESEEQYLEMRKENFNSIYDLIYNIVQARKGEGWEPDLESPVEIVVESFTDLSYIGSF
jgi:hypothetical protein